MYISAVIFLPLLKDNEPDNSVSNEEYSSDLTITILDEEGSIIGSCESLPDPFSQSESDCGDLFGSRILVKRTCASCKLGACSIGVMTDSCGRC